MFAKVTAKIAVAAMIVCLGLFVIIQGCGKEHPEHPEKSGSGITKDDLADAVESYIEHESDDNNGIFIVVDDVTGEKLELVLDRVHRERVSKVGENKYFACADFTTADGVVYDLDVFMEGPEADELEFDEFTVHKVDGKERYIWAEEEGIWVKKPVTE